MIDVTPAWRSMLFIPVLNERFLGRASQRGADAIQLDLEDAIPPSQKLEARRAVPAAAASLAAQGLDVVVRINRPWRQAVADIEAAVGPDVCCLTLPKVPNVAHVRAIAEILDEVESDRGMRPGHTRLVVMIETAEYTTFSYSGLNVPASVTAGSPLVAEATVTNTGSKAGDEVAQLYLTFPKVAGAPIKALRGFQRIHLEAGASQKVRFELNPRDMSMVSAAGEPIVAEGAYTVTVGGGQPGTGAPEVAGKFDIQGSQTLPE